MSAFWVGLLLPISTKTISIYFDLKNLRSKYLEMSTFITYLGLALRQPCSGLNPQKLGLKWASHSISTAILAKDCTKS